ncbi:guanosine-5'-triphosphate,3'-diphosphate diphosphatase [Gayadomonas joobiniege]|uniref:guanosine-5'-triphosphate,3'-diphosphate diphosphatase n=1 Tax=Gayadomonas joobiniege TaxID=1234606 RepID=UPI0003799C6B|nr:guanosine-5'-triphosphate,3'-diphosphate diphosphatase [Gayadomonas joobiniege]
MEQRYPVYAAIDLGSNSFHMLIVRSVEGSVQTIGKIKRKVRLASGLDTHGNLNQAAMARGWDCLSLFAERLQDIPSANVRIVGTAALRLAKNRAEFLTRAEAILQHKIEVIEGTEEGRLIYIGVANTSGTSRKKLVIDIGGASTEIIVGEGFKPKLVNSLNLGCVTCRSHYFNNGTITSATINAALQNASEQILPLVAEYQNQGWQSCLGASGTPQAIQEVLIAMGQSELITLAKLEHLVELSIACGHIDELTLPGLREERRPVFISGLIILMAAFKALNIEYMVVAGGALREGIVYSMLPDLQQKDIRQRSLNSFVQRYQLDKEHSIRVCDTALALFDQLSQHWALDQFESRAVLHAAGVLHEVGLAIDFKDAPAHAGYILSNTSIPGFSLAQRKLLITLVSNYRDDIKLEQINQQTMTDPQLAAALVRILRLAVILTMRRKNEALPKFTAFADQQTLSLRFPKHWLAQHPLMENELHLEQEYQEKAGWQFTFS